MKIDKVKGRDKKTSKYNNKMVVRGRSIFTLAEQIVNGEQKPKKKKKRKRGK